MRSTGRKPARRRAAPAPAARTRSRRSPPARANLRRTLADLRVGKEAVSDLFGQLDALSTALREPVPAIDAAAPERLAGAARQAQRAFSALEELRRLFP